MNATMTVNGSDHSINLKVKDQSFNAKATMALVKELGIEWLSADIFIANFPEDGRFLMKKPGVEQMSAGG